MTKAELIDGLIANEATQFTDDDRDWLDVLHKDQLERLSPVANEGGDEPCCPDEVAALIANENSGWTADDAAMLNTLSKSQLEKLQPRQEEPKVNTVDEFIEAAPAEMQDVLRSGVEMHRSKKSGVIQKILANKRNKFTEEQLRSKDLGELEAISDLAHTPDYSGRGGDGNEPHVNKEEVLEVPTINWDA